VRLRQHRFQMLQRSYAGWAHLACLLIGSEPVIQESANAGGVARGVVLPHRDVVGVRVEILTHILDARHMADAALRRRLGKFLCEFVALRQSMIESLTFWCFENLVQESRF